MVKKKKIYKDYKELLHEQLQDQKFAIAYLNEALHDEDQNVFLIALKDVLDAQGENVSAIARAAHINRQNLYRMLSKKGNPHWNNLSSLIGAMGLEVTLTYR
jgi:probable addiction module antidote protein